MSGERGPAWTERLDESTVAAVHELQQAAGSHDGIAALDEASMLRLPHAGQALHLLTRDGDALVGYAQLAPDGTAHLLVHPGARRRGHGAALLAAVLDRGPREGDRPAAQVWAHGSLPAATALAAAARMEPVRLLSQLTRSLTDLPPVPDTGGVTLRPFRVGQDDDAWVAVNAAAFADHPEQGSMTVADLRERQQQSWFDPAGLLMADRDGELLGFCWTKIEGGVGEIYVVAVAEAGRGMGLGGTLTLSGLHFLRQRKLTDAALFVDGENARAMTLYRRLGFVEKRADRLFQRH